MTTDKITLQESNSVAFCSVSQEPGYYKIKDIEHENPLIVIFGHDDPTILFISDHR